MSKLTEFIAESRAKGLDDQSIEALLVGQGWSQSQVKAAILGIEAPAPDNVTSETSVRADTPEAVPSKPAHKSIGALEASLQHILLWVFTGTSSIMFGVVAGLIYESAQTGSGNNDSYGVMVTYWVLEVVTFVLFAVVYALYLKKLRRDTELGTGRVWSIITIVLHSLGFMGALVTMLLVALLPDLDSTAVFVAAAAIALMNLIVVGAYFVANFLPKLTKSKKIIMYAFPATLLLLVIGFGVAASIKSVGSRDDYTRVTNLVNAVSDIRSYALRNEELPENLSQASEEDGVEYKKLNNRAYEVCATFDNDYSSARGGYQSSAPQDDAYVSRYDFEQHGQGKQCWEYQSAVLMNQYDDYPYQSPSPEFRGLDDAQAV